MLITSGPLISDFVIAAMTKNIEEYQRRSVERLDRLLSEEAKGI